MYCFDVLLIIFNLHDGTPSCRGGGTVHPAIPDLRRTYGSVYARFDAGFTFRFRWVRVRFSWDPYRISTDFRIRTGFRTQVE